MFASAKLFQTAQNQLDHSRLIALINSLGDGFLALDIWKRSLSFFLIGMDWIGFIA